MKGFIEVPYGDDSILLNVMNVLAVRPYLEEDPRIEDCETVIFLNAPGVVGVKTDPESYLPAWEGEITPYIVGTSLYFREVVALISEALK